MLEKFKEPTAEYRIAPLWLWNGTPDADDVERQIRDMHRSGFGGFFIVECNSARMSSNGEWIASIDRARILTTELGMLAGTMEPNLTDDHPSIFPNSSSQENQTPEHIHNSDFIMGNNWPVHPQTLTLLREKLGVSLAHNADMNRIMSFPFARSAGYLSIEQMKAEIDRDIAMGINVFCPQIPLYDYSCPTPPFATPHFRHLADYTARLCFALSQGRHKAQIALINPTQDLAYEYALNPKGPIPRLIIDYFSVFCEQLIRQHIDYDILSDDTLELAMVVDQQLIVGDEDYELIIIPPLTAISCAAARKIADYVEDGGALLASTLLPFRDASGDNHEEVLGIFRKIFDIDPYQLRDRATHNDLRRQPLLRHNFGNLLFFESSQAQELVPCLRGTVQMAIKPEVSIRSQNNECPDVIYMHRSAGDNDFFFFLNTSPDPRSVKISIRCDKSPTVLDPETGELIALANCSLKGSRTVFEYCFRRHESLLVYFSDDILLPAAPKSTGNGYEIALATEWSFQLDGPNNITVNNWHIGSSNQHNGGEIVSAFYIESRLDDLKLSLTPAIFNSKRAVYINDQRADRIINTGIEVEEYNISAIIRTGHNVIRLETECQPQSEPAYFGIKARLTGDFSLNSTQPVLSTPKNRIRNGSWTDQGYPFYSGSATYSQEIEIPELYAGQRVFLRTDEAAEIVEFIVNGVTAAIRLWAPYEAEITKLIHSGSNLILLKVTNTFANACLNEIRPSGLLRGARIIIC